MGGQVGTSIYVLSALRANATEDTLKGSYYANPVVDSPSVSADLQQQYPEYYGTNICTLSRCFLLSVASSLIH